jgi:hypothetical protein
MLRSEVDQKARFDPGDRVRLPNEPLSTMPWRIDKVYWSAVEGIVYDLERDTSHVFRIAEDKMELVDGGVKLF